MNLSGFLGLSLLGAMAFSLSSLAQQTPMSNSAGTVQSQNAMNCSSPGGESRPECANLPRGNGTRMGSGDTSGVDSGTSGANDSSGASSSSMGTESGSATGRGSSGSSGAGTRTGGNSSTNSGGGHL
jgi:hypothetical protein